MNDELLAKCIRATANEGEFSRNTSNSSRRKMTESATVVNPPKPEPVQMIPDSANQTDKVSNKDAAYKTAKATPIKMVPDPVNQTDKISGKLESYYDEDNDEFVDMTYTDAQGTNLDPDEEGTDVAVIDTDLSASEEQDANPVDYIGKYVIRCPICLNPMFSEKCKGEVLCPVCDKEIELTEDDILGKVAPVTEGEPAPQVADDTASDNIDVDDTKDESCNRKRGKKKAPKTEAVVDGSSFEIYLDDLTEKAQSELIDFLGGDNGNYDVIPLATIYNDEMDESCNKKAKTEGEEVCPDCGKPVAQCDCLKAPKTEGCDDGKTCIKVCPEGGVKVCNDKVKVKIAPPDCGDSVAVDDVDVDEFDTQVNELVDNAYDDETLEYESKSIARNGKGFIIEGVIRSSKLHRSSPVKFICTESKSKVNKFTFEGLSGLKGTIKVESSYNKAMKSLKLESMSYKLLCKNGTTSRILESKSKK